MLSELLNKVLASKQQDYDTKLATFDKLRAKIDEVSSLAGYATKRHAEKTQEYETEIAKISNLSSCIFSARVWKRFHIGGPHTYIGAIRVNILI